MKTPPVKLDWLTRVRQVREYHVTRCKEDKAWTLEDTARELNRSLGSVSQDLLVATWLKTHESQISRFKTFQGALDFVRQKKNELRLSL